MIDKEIKRLLLGIKVIINIWTFLQVRMVYGSIHTIIGLIILSYMNSMIKIPSYLSQSLMPLLLLEFRVKRVS